MFTTQQPTGVPKVIMEAGNSVPKVRNTLYDECCKTIYEAFRQHYEVDIPDTVMANIISYWFESVYQTSFSKHNIMLPHFGKFGVPNHRRYYRHLEEIEGITYNDFMKLEDRQDFTKVTRRIKTFDISDVSNLINSL